jgi:predicted Zn-dependent protease
MRLLAVGSLCVVMGCAASPPASQPPTARRDTKASTEVSVGVALSELLSGGYAPYGDPKLVRYVQGVGERIARVSERPELPWRFIVSEDPEIGAQALPGGRVILSRNLLPYLADEAELAAILAHEVAHVALKHGNKVWADPLPEPSGGEASERAQRLEEDEERQADAVAVRYLGAAGYSPQALGSALEAIARAALRECVRTRQPEGCERDTDSTSDAHPPLPARLARAAVAAGGRSGERGAERFLSALEGLHFGDPTDAPALSGRRFGVAGSLSFELPQGYQAEARAGVLSGSSEPKLAMMRLRGELWPNVMKSVLESQAFTARSVAGASALVGRVSRDVPSSVALVQDASGAYLLMVDGDGVASRALLESILDSARREPPGARRVPRIFVVAARERETFAKLVAARCPETPLELARGLNRLEPGARLASGQAVKCLSTR